MGKLLPMKTPDRKTAGKTKQEDNRPHTPREDVEYIMDTFPIVKRKDMEKHGSYRTKEMIMREYDKLAGSPLLAPPKPKARMRKR